MKTFQLSQDKVVIADEKYYDALVAMEKWSYHFLIFNWHNLYDEELTWLSIDLGDEDETW